MSAADVKAREAMQEAILTAWDAMGRDGSQTLSGLAADVALAAIAAEREAAAKVCEAAQDGMDDSPGSIGAWCRTTLNRVAAAIRARGAS